MCRGRLLTNHVLLLITPHEEQSIAKVIQLLGCYYLQYYNDSYLCTGTPWEGRYKATLIDSKTCLLNCIYYIEINPVRARAVMVAHPSEYPWSSYRHNALGQADELVTPHLEYRRLGKTAEKHQAVYR
jgi:putative transposase